MMRPREPPIAARTAISRVRPVARASRRLATFAHAMRSTSDDRTDHHVERRADVLHQDVSDRIDAEAVAAAQRVWKLREKLLGRRTHPLLSLRQRDAGLEPRRRLEIVALIGRVGIEPERKPDLRWSTELAEAEFAKHSDDEVRVAAERDRLADGLAIAVEPALPELAAQDHDALAPRTIIVRTERPAGLEWRAEELEEIGADVARAELFREVSPGVIDDAGVERGGLLDDLRLGAPMHELRRGRPGPLPLSRGVHEHHEPVGLRHVHRPQQDGVDDRENGRVGADAERQRGQGGERERRVLAQHPDGQAQVFEERLYMAHRSLVTNPRGDWFASHTTAVEGIFQTRSADWAAIRVQLAGPNPARPRPRIGSSRSCCARLLRLYVQSGSHRSARALMEHTSPSRIGRYVIVRPLGRGGMGSIFLARDPAIDRFVAVKLMREGFEDARRRERFAREAQSIGRMQHQNIVTVFDVGEHEGEPFIAMEYVEGRTLASVIAYEETSLPRKLQIIDELCAGLHHAHRAGIVHRDIKPANIMVDVEGTVKILDFGIARGAAAGLTQSEAILGTLRYMSPEQLANKNVDHRTDIYAMGAVFYELLSGRKAYPGEALSRVLNLIVDAGPEPLSRLCPDVDPDVIAIVDRCLQKDRGPSLS